MLTALRITRAELSDHRRELIIGGLLTVVSVLVSLAEPWPLKFIVDDVLAPTVSADERRFRLSLAVGAMVGVVGLNALVAYWSTRLLSSAGLRIAADLRLRVMNHLQSLPLRYHQDNRVGDQVSRVIGDVDRLQDMLVQQLSTLAPNVGLLAGMITVMVVLDPTFTLLALITAGPLALATHRSRRRLRMAARATRKADGAVASAATETLSTMHMVQAFTLEPTREAAFRTLTGKSLATGLDAVRYQARFAPLVDLAGLASAALVLWFGAVRVIDGRMQLGTMLLFLSYLGSLFKPIKALTKLSSIVTKGTVSAERLHGLLAVEPMPQPTDVSRAAAIRGTVRFDDVTFSYGREPVLRGLSFEIAAGETVALVGQTGAGKSTIAALIPRLMDVDDGAVLIDGTDVRDVRLRSLRSQIGLVLQDCVLFDGTLRDNIVCGHRYSSDRWVERAAKLALVDEFADRLPDGLDTRVGERGVNLSGGQRQRIAIARAIIRETPILILDEPTSALDPASEELLVAALNNLPGGRTKIVIAHRMSTIRDADRILVLEHGRLAAAGTHDELSKVDGLYRRLASSSVLAPPVRHHPRPLLFPPTLHTPERRHL